MYMTRWVGQTKSQSQALAVKRNRSYKSCKVSTAFPRTDERSVKLDIVILLCWEVQRNKLFTFHANEFAARVCNPSMEPQHESQLGWYHHMEAPPIAITTAIKIRVVWFLFVRHLCHECVSVMIRLHAHAKDLSLSWQDACHCIKNKWT